MGNALEECQNCDDIKNQDFDINTLVSQNVKLCEFKLEAQSGQSLVKKVLETNIPSNERLAAERRKPNRFKKWYKLEGLADEIAANKQFETQLGTGFGLPKDCNLGENYIGVLDEGNRLHGVCKIFDTGEDRIQARNELTFFYCNYEHGVKVGSGISIVIIEQPHRRIFSMFVGSHSGNQRTQGFYLIASKFNNESNAEKMPNYFFNGILRNDRLFKGFRKELNCKYHEYLGQFNEGNFFGQACSRLLVKNPKSDEQCEYQYYEGGYERGMKQGKGKLIFYHDLEEEKLKSKIDERRELMIDQLFADQYNYESFSNLFAELAAEKFVQFTGARHQQVIRSLEITWAGGKAQGLGIQICPNKGYVFKGIFKNNKRTGYGEEQRGDTLVKGFYQDNQITESVAPNGQKLKNGGQLIGGIFSRLSCA